MSSNTLAPETPHKRIFGLDLMRAVAVGLVLLCHALYFLIPFVKPIEGLAVLMGVLGVEIFFVLSGFLIGGILIRECERGLSLCTLQTFWTRRWFRTLPNYYLFLVVNVVLALFAGRTLPSILPYLCFMQSLRYKDPDFFVESWSLAIEEGFYLLFPIVLLGSARILSSTKWAAPATNFIIAATLFLGVSFLARVVIVLFLDPPGWDSYVRHALLCRLDAPIYGLIAAWVKAYHGAAWSRRSPHFVSLAILCFLLTLFMFQELASSRNFSSLYAIFVFSVAALCFSFILPHLDAWKHSASRLGRWVTSLSIWSYSLYLCQLPISIILRKAFPALSSSLSGAIFGSFVFVALSVVCAKCCYLFYESRMTRLREVVGR